MITDKYLAESGCKTVTMKLKKKFFACYSDTGTKLLRYFNNISNNSAYEHNVGALKT